MLLPYLAPQEHAGQADRSDGAPKVAVLMAQMHMIRCTPLEATLTSLSPAEMPEPLRLATLSTINELVGDQFCTPSLRQALLCRHQVR